MDGWTGRSSTWRHQKDQKTTSSSTHTHQGHDIHTRGEWRSQKTHQTACADMPLHREGPETMDRKRGQREPKRKNASDTERMTRRRNVSERETETLRISHRGNPDIFFPSCVVSGQVSDHAETYRRTDTAPGCRPASLAVRRSEVRLSRRKIN